MTVVTPRNQKASLLSPTTEPEGAWKLAKKLYSYSYLTWFCTSLVVLHNFHEVSYIFSFFHKPTLYATSLLSYIFSYNLRIPFTGHIGQLSIISFFDFFVVYVISSFSHFIVTMIEIAAASPNKEEQEQEISIREFVKTLKQFKENMQLMF